MLGVLDAGGQVVAWESEGAIFEALGVGWMEPGEREGVLKVASSE
jgi:DNA polymerase/3'-5' exonuclease PolX